MLEKVIILVVEDSPDFRELIVDILDTILDRDAELIEAGHGEEAISILQERGQNLPHLILTDIMMPNMDGNRLIKAVKAHDGWKHIPIIVISALASEFNIFESLRNGADDYITKPLKAEEVILRVNNRLRILDLEYELRKALQEENKNLKSVIKTMQPIFISYSHSDISYAQILATALRQNGFDVWFDERISHGNKWFQTIVSAIENCAAFIVIMTPEAENSEWVHKEILLAKRANKKIFPLLLNGQEFAILIDTQFFDVQNYKLPDKSFFKSLSLYLEQEPLE